MATKKQPAAGKAAKKPKLSVIFYATEAGKEPVRQWVRSLPVRSDRQKIGRDIATVQREWPVGLPTCRTMGDGLFEVRTNLEGNRIARVMFYIDRRGRVVLLHGFIKKTQKTPGADIDIARKHKRNHEIGLT